MRVGGSVGATAAAAARAAEGSRRGSCAGGTGSGLVSPDAACEVETRPARLNPLPLILLLSCCTKLPKYQGTLVDLWLPSLAVEAASQGRAARLSGARSPGRPAPVEAAGRCG